MRIAPPGGELTFWSAMWILLGIAYSYFGVRTGEAGYFVLAAAVSVPAIGMWLGIRSAGYILPALFVLAIPLAVYGLIFVDETLRHRGVRLIKVAAAGYFAWLSFRWAREDG